VTPHMLDHGHYRMRLGRPAGARQAAATAWLPAAVGDEHS
jgi:hypothetical protein